MNITLDEIRSKAPKTADFYALEGDTVTYYQWKQNEGYRYWSAWGWLGCNIYGLELKPL